MSKEAIAKLGTRVWQLEKKLKVKDERIVKLSQENKKLKREVVHLQKKLLDQLS